MREKSGAKSEKSESKPDACFYGTVTIGERGQIVIPADLRKEMEMQAGDKLLVMKHPAGKGVMLFPVEAFREFMQGMIAGLESVNQHVANTTPAGKQGDSREGGSDEVESREHHS